VASSTQFHQRPIQAAVKLHITSQRASSSRAAGILQPFPPDQSLPKEKITALDSRYTAVIQALDDLVGAVGLKAA
jgi:hypothetical protein